MFVNILVKAAVFNFSFLSPITPFIPSYGSTISESISQSIVAINVAPDVSGSIEDILYLSNPSPNELPSAYITSATETSVAK
ncbi:hypothetical protein D3C73_1525120 [compost metagenome]